MIVAVVFKYAGVWVKPAMSSDCCVSNNLFPIGNWNEESVAEEEAKSIHDDSMILIVDHCDGDDDDIGDAAMPECNAIYSRVI